MNPLKGELEYGSISLDDKEDYRLYRYSDAGMGETEYRIFRNGAFFAMFDTRKDAEEVMTVMTHKSERETVLGDEHYRNALSLCDNLLVHLEDNDITYLQIKKTVALVKKELQKFRQVGSP